MWPQRVLVTVEQRVLNIAQSKHGAPHFPTSGPVPDHPLPVLRIV